jgi:hypothetical protein
MRLGCEQPFLLGDVLLEDVGLQRAVELSEISCVPDTVPRRGSAIGADRESVAGAGETSRAHCPAGTAVPRATTTAEVATVYFVENSREMTTCGSE